jgi:hypothetical protein
VAFFSQADNLVPGDTNGVGDIFVHDSLGRLPGDMNQDGKVDGADLPDFIAAWKNRHAGQDWDRAADMNGDADLTIQDAVLYIEAVLKGSR